jgi:hypothetical protein
LALAVLISVGLHSGLPLIWNAEIRQSEAVSVMEIIAAPPPDIPMPESDKVIEAPPDDQIGEPEKGKPVDDPGDEGDSKSPDPAPTVPDPEPAPPPPLPRPTPPSDRPNAVKTLPNENIESLVDRIARRKRERAEASKRAREGRRGGQGGTGDKPGGGSGPRTRTKKGKPGAVYVCHKDGLGQELVVRTERPVADWVTIVPTVLMPFKTRPGLGDYLKRMRQVVWRHRRNVRPMGPVEFALPAETLQMPLDHPPGVRAIVGRPEGRCLVGMKYSRQLFPFSLKHVPIRLLDKRNKTVDAVVDIRFYKDGSFNIKSRDGTKLPFLKGRLKNSKGIKRTIEEHYNAARTLKDIAGWFGIDVNKAVRDARKKKRRDRQRQQKKTARNR